MRYLFLASAVLLTFVFALVGSSVPVHAQLQIAGDVAEEAVPLELPPAKPAAADQAKKHDASESADAEPSPASELPPRTVKVHLHDGSVIAGVLANKTIEVQTQFGRLTVPVDKITSLTPGLDSQTERMENLKRLIDQLGDASYSTRDKAEKELLLMGRKIRDELERYREDENAERRTRVQKILTALDDLAAEELGIDGDQDSSQAWRRLDTVVTEPFTLAGRIEQKQFELDSKYGKLNIALADIRSIERPHAGREAIRRSVAVAGSNIVPRQYKNSQIAVQPGDRVTIKADGVLQMTPWGSSAMSTPDGAPNYGWYVNAKIPSGALVMRVGSTGEPIKVGSKHTFTAKKAGTLQFGIGMNASYMNQNFPGTYNLKISVQPAGS